MMEVHSAKGQSGFGIRYSNSPSILPLAAGIGHASFSGHEPDTSEFVFRAPIPKRLRLMRMDYGGPSSRPTGAEARGLNRPKRTAEFANLKGGCSRHATHFIGMASESLAHSGSVRSFLPDIILRSQASDLSSFSPLLSFLWTGT